jgi:hypothetical protein
VQRLGRLGRKVADKIPFTPLALLVVGGAAIAARYFGTRRQDLVLWVVGYGVAALVVLTTLLVVTTTIVLRLAYRAERKEDERVEAGASADTGFSLPSLGWLPLVSVRWEWRDPEGVSVETEVRGGRLHERVRYGERGEYPHTLRRVIVEDVFGFARLALWLIEPSARTVWPARARPLTATLLQAMASGDLVSHPAGQPEGDLIEMRRYQPGDPIKRVLWKTFARTRTLMVRLPEKAIAPTKRTLAFFAVGAGDEAAASVARVALESGSLGTDWRFGCDGASEDARRVPEALAMVVRSRAAREHGGAGLAGFLDRATDFHAARLLLFAPGTPGPWLDAIEREVKRRAVPAQVILGVDGLVEDEAARRRGAWLLMRERAAPVGATRASAVNEVRRRLLAIGCVVTVVDRTTGKALASHGRRRAA